MAALRVRAGRAQPMNVEPQLFVRGCLALQRMGACFRVRANGVRLNAQESSAFLVKRNLHPVIVAHTPTARRTRSMTGAPSDRAFFAPSARTDSTYATSFWRTRRLSRAVSNRLSKSDTSCFL